MKHGWEGLDSPAGRESRAGNGGRRAGSGTGADLANTHSHLSARDGKDFHHDNLPNSTSKAQNKLEAGDESSD